LCGGGSAEILVFEFLSVPDLLSAPWDAVDVDGVGTVCGVTDGLGRRDNYLPELLADFDAEVPDVDVRSVIDGVEICDGVCEGPLRLERETGTDCTSYRVLANDGSVVAQGTGDAQGGSLSSLSLAFVIDGEDLVQVDLAAVQFRFDADTSRLVLGGYLDAPNNQALAEALCAQANGCDPTMFVAEWASLGDVDLAGQCTGLSLALSLGRTSFE